MSTPHEPIQSAVPAPGLTPVELLQDLVSRMERGNAYARSRKVIFSRRSTVVRVASLAMSAASTVVLGLQDLDFWTGLGFALIALVTAVNTFEPLFAWRSRWVLMEEAQYEFYRLRDDVTFYLASTPTEQLDPERIRSLFEQYQGIWDRLSSRWLEFRRAGSSNL
jgi:hypothetical protein